MSNRSRALATLREWVARLRSALRPSRRDAELEEELRLHLEMAQHERRQADSNVDAVRAAAIRYGSVAQGMDALRDQRGLPWIDDLVRDLRYGLRALRRNPLFAAVAVLTLALGIGANTAIFSLADAALMRTLPVSNPRELVVLRQIGPGGDIFPFTAAAAADLALSRNVLSGLAAFRPLPDTHVSVNGETELAHTQSVSGTYYAVLGVRATIGRLLTEQDREPVAVISHRYWRRRFAADPNVLGRALEMQERSFTIV
jgi:putative ABC transport system permease protein